MMLPLRIDLHTHSTASDGAYAPEAVIQIALTNRVDVLALTDHDTAAGLDEAQRAAADTALCLVPGIELTCVDGDTQRDLLGYLFDPRHAALTGLFNDLRAARLERARDIVRKLAGLGLDVPWEAVQQTANGATVGRPHIARVMLQRGMVGSLQGAFDQYLAEGRPAFAPHRWLTCAQAIAHLHAAGGIAVMAHPVRYKDYREALPRLVALGLDGVEVYYPDHTPALNAELAQFATAHRLWMTGGSDFHRRDGDGKAAVGSVRIPPDLNFLTLLRERGLLPATA